MLNLLDVPLANGQRLQERRACPPPNMPATRADQIIAEGDRRRCEYRRLNPNADTAMVYGTQVGYLHAQVRILANEADELNIRRNPKLRYEPVNCTALDAQVFVGFTYTPGEDAKTYGPPELCHDGSPDCLEVAEVWANGLEVSAALREDVTEQISDALLERVRLLDAKGREFDEVGG